MRPTRFAALLLLLLPIACRRKPEPPPAVVTWVEMDRKTHALEAYPLFALSPKGLVDISIDPEQEKRPPLTLPGERFPLKAQPRLTASIAGKALGTLDIKGFAATQVACNELVLAQVAWTSTNHAKAPQAFLATTGLPPQGSWKGTLPEATQTKVRQDMLAEVRQRFELGPGDRQVQASWHWFSLGARGQGCALSMSWRSPQRTVTCNRILSVSPDGTFRTLLALEGSGDADGVEGTAEMDFLDALDVDGDGIPELLFLHHAYESNAFILMKLTGDQATQIWTGSPYGC